MKYYPIFLDVQDKTCLVVGGGKVGTRKALGLAKANARVRVVSPGFSPELENNTHPNICLDNKTFDASDLQGACLVFAATDSSALNAQIRDAARRAGILCNIADGDDKGDFILPSVVSREDLILAVSTCGSSPAMAKRLRRELEAKFGPEYGTALTLMANIRTKLLARGHDPEGHKKVFTALVASGLPELIAAGDQSRIDAVLAEVLGSGFTFDGLVGQPPATGLD
ncbi:MAG: bifunctional precorrin-2 dehydrogenase/sirohydrochlorin ferrochelatase [Desulfobacter sp.]